MRPRPLVILSCVASLVFAACEKKAAPAAPATGAATPTAAAPVAPVTPPVARKPAKLPAAERAAKLGFVKRLPKDAESVISFYNGTGVMERLKKTKLWAVLNAESGGGLDHAGEAGEGELGVSTYLGKEFFLATGKGTAAQFGNLMTFSHRMNYFQIRALAASFAKAAKEGKLSGYKPDNKEFESMFFDLLKDPQSGVGLLERSQMPPLWIGFKVGDEQRGKVLQEINGLLGLLASDETIAKPVSFERGGGKFSGYKILGDGLAKQMESAREEMEQKMDANLVTRLIAAVKSKNLVIAPGIVDDYVIIFLGSSEDECQFAKDPGESLASTDPLDFADGYAKKDIACFCYGASGVMDVIRASTADSLTPMVTGIRDGLGESEASGDLKDVQALLQIVSERGESLYKMLTADTTGLLAYFDNGLRVESYGGTDNGAITWDKPHHLSQLGAGPDVALFADWSSNPEYNKKASSYIEALMETAYAIAMKVAASPGAEEGDMAKFSRGIKLYDTKFREDLLAIWSALSGDFREGLGNEGAFVVDLKGTVPPFPGLPQKLVDNGKFVRISLVHPVADRAKLDVSWAKMNGALTHIVKTAGELADKEIPMQKPMSADKDDLKTWFFTMPFMTDDFVPNVSLSDKWFIASTSKLQAQEIARQAAAGTDGETGATFVLHSDAFVAAARQWLNALDENKAEIFKGKGNVLKKYPRDKEKVAKVIDAMGELDSINLHVRREDGVLRSSFYIKAR